MKAGEFEQAEDALSRLMQRVSHLHVRLRDSNWADLSSIGFVREATECLDDLTGLRKHLEEMQYYAKEDKELDFEQLIKEFKKLEKKLENNIELEEKKKSNLKEIHPQLKEEQPELFSSLQQSILSLLLKTRFLLERTSLHLEKKAPSPAEKEKAGERKELMELLEEKEQELQALREKYDEIKKSTVLGFKHEESAAELEKQMVDLSNRFERERNSLEKLGSEFRSTISSLQAEFMELNDKMGEIEGIYSDFSEKATDLIMLLKKERDFAKKTVLDIENEVLQLRATYSRKLIKLEEEKAKAREKARSGIKKEIEKLRAELEEKEEMLKHFKDLAKRKEKKSRELEEKIAYLNAAMQSKKSKKKKKSKKSKTKKKK